MVAEGAPAGAATPRGVTQALTAAEGTEEEAGCAPGRGSGGFERAGPLGAATVVSLGPKGAAEDGAEPAGVAAGRAEPAGMVSLGALTISSVRALLPPGSEELLPPPPPPGCGTTNWRYCGTGGGWGLAGGTRPLAPTASEDFGGDIPSAYTAKAFSANVPPAAAATGGGAAVLPTPPTAAALMRGSCCCFTALALAAAASALAFSRLSAITRSLACCSRRSRC